MCARHFTDRIRYGEERYSKEEDNVHLKDSKREWKIYLAYGRRLSYASLPSAMCEEGPHHCGSACRGNPKNDHSSNIVHGARRLSLRVLILLDAAGAAEFVGDVAGIARIVDVIPGSVAGDVL